MFKSNWRLLLGLALVALSLFLYLVHYLIFRDSRHIFIYLLGDIAFIPIQVLLVTLILDELLSAREKSARLSKMNMAIGTFFSEVGATLLKSFSSLDSEVEHIRRALIVTSNWTDQSFDAVGSLLSKHAYHIGYCRAQLGYLRDLLLRQRSFLVILLENPNLLEHEAFTELLRAVFHLSEELAYRTDVERLSDADYEHLSGDIRRVYVLLVQQWLAYMHYLQRHYPYLFSLAMRTNPFDPTASPEIRVPPPKNSASSSPTTVIS